MIIKYSTKKDINGNRYFLGIDTDKKVFSRESAHWFCREDIIEISRKDRRRIVDELENNGYTEIDYM